MKLTELEEKYPCTKELVEALKEAEKTATPEQKEIINHFVDVLNAYLERAPYKKEVVKSIYYALTHGLTVKSLTRSLEKTLKTMRKPVIPPKEIRNINDLAKALYETCNEEKIKEVLETLYDFVPFDKRERAFYEAKEVFERSNNVLTNL